MRDSLSRISFRVQIAWQRFYGITGQRGAIDTYQPLPGEATPGQEVAPAQLLDQDGLLALDGAGVDLAGGAELVRRQMELVEA